MQHRKEDHHDGALEGLSRARTGAWRACGRGALLFLGVLATAAWGEPLQGAGTPAATPGERAMVRLGLGTAGLDGAIGANYHLSSSRQSLEHWFAYDSVRAAQELSFLRAQGFNALRTFLNFDVYEADPQAFLADLHHFALRMASERILFIPVLFDSFGEEPSGELPFDASSPAWVKSPATATILQPDFLLRAQQYVSDVVLTVNAAQAEVADPEVWWLLDVWNEPALATANIPLLAQLLEHLQSQPQAPPATVGFASFEDNGALLAELSDPAALAVISGHPYGMFEEVLVHQTALGKQIGDAYGGKPVLVSEIGLPGLFQDYGNVLRWLEGAQVGFTLWEAYVGNNQFRNLTGIFYPEPESGGFVTVRSITAANALWALAQRRDPSFVAESVARYRLFEDPDFVVLGPGAITVSTGAYHTLLRDHPNHYGTERFPWLDVTKPATLALYQKLVSWAFLSLGRFLSVDSPTADEVLADLSEMSARFEIGDREGAEASLFQLFTMAAQLMGSSGAGEPENYRPEVLNADIELIVRDDGTFDARFEAVVFDLDVDTLLARLFVHDLQTDSIFELPIVGIPDTGAFVHETSGLQSTGGSQYVLALFVSDGRGAHALRLVPVTLP